MKTWKIGEKSRAACEDCGKLVDTTFGLHDVPISGSEVSVRSIMAASCDECGGVVAIPPMSADMVREAILAHRDGTLAHRPSL